MEVLPARYNRRRPNSEDAQMRRLPSRDETIIAGGAPREPIRWALHAVVFSSCLIGIALVIMAVRDILPTYKEAELSFGFFLMGLTSLSFQELISRRDRLRVAKLHRAEQETERSERDAERAAEGARHASDEAKLRQLHDALTDALRRAKDLEALLGITGAQLCDRVANALLLGYYFDHRDVLPTGARSTIFASAAWSLGLGNDLAIIETMEPHRGALGIFCLQNYGPVVSAAFEAGVLLRNLETGGFDAMNREDSLPTLEHLLQQLKVDDGLLAAARRFWIACRFEGRIPPEALHFFESLCYLLVQRFSPLSADHKKFASLQRRIEHPIRIPKSVRVADVGAPQMGKKIDVLVYGRVVRVLYAGDRLMGFDLGDIPDEADLLWEGKVVPTRTYDVEPDGDGLILRRKWGYADERPLDVKITVAPPSNPTNREPKELVVKDIAEPMPGDSVEVVTPNRCLIIFNDGGTMYALDKSELEDGHMSAGLLVWDVRSQDERLILRRCWRYNDEAE